MKLDRLNAASRPAPPEHTTHSAIPQVDWSEAVDAERRRSLQQELAEIEAKAVGPFEGEERIHADAHAIASELSQLGQRATALVRPDKASHRQTAELLADGHLVDAKA